MGLVKDCQDAERLPKADSHKMALLAFTMVHGMAKLAITGPSVPFLRDRGSQLCGIRD
jgi:hypothetical protein